MWQRWRVLHSSVQGVAILQILNAKTMKPADKCEMMLYAKDGESRRRAVRHNPAATALPQRRTGDR